jgi:hypothetical protein
METIPPLGVAIWVAGILLLAYAFFQMYRRGLYRDFPIFFGYLAFHLLHAAIGLWVSETMRIDFVWNFMWGGEVVDGPLSVALIYELFAKTLAPYGGIQKLGKLLFLTSILVLAVVGVWIAVSDPHSFVQHKDTAVISMDRSLDFARVALMFLLFAFHRVLGLNWRHYLFGIALGLSVGSAIALLSETLRLQIGMSWWKPFSYLLPFSYDIGCVIWAFYLTSQESTISVAELPSSSALAKWNEAIQEILAH